MEPGALVPQPDDRRIPIAMQGSGAGIGGGQMVFSLQEAREQGIAAGREWIEGVIKPHQRRVAVGKSAEAVFAEMEAEGERELLRQIQAGARDLRQAGQPLDRIEEWTKGFALGAGWRAKELSAQIAAAND